MALGDKIKIICPTM